jgi:AcrR family transcriptional regulator
MTTSEAILNSATRLLAQHGAAGTTMRAIASDTGVQASVIYHYYATKEDLLRSVRQQLNTQLDAAFDQAPPVADAPAWLRQRLTLNFEHREHIVSLLQYFMAAKADFPQQDGGYVPPRAYRHMREIIDRGISEGVYRSDNPDFDAKILAHLVNGFLIEHYPHDLTPPDQARLVEQIASFIERALGRTT